MNNNQIQNEKKRKRCEDVLTVWDRIPNSGMKEEKRIKYSPCSTVDDLFSMNDDRLDAFGEAVDLLVLKTALVETKTALAEVKKEMYTNCFTIPKLLPLGYRFNAYRSSSVPSSKEGAELVVGSFHALEQGISYDLHFHTSLPEIFDVTGMDYSGEVEVTRIVRAVLLDCVKASNMPMVKIFNEGRIMNLYPDLLVVQFFKSIGVCVVKAPSGKLLTNEHILGQIYDYMLLLKNYHGVCWPLGILTNYEHWIILWFGDAASVASCRTMEDLAALRRSAAVDEIPAIQVVLPSVMPDWDRGI